MLPLRADFDVAILGAGLVGLACAEAVARLGPSVVVLERHRHFARETSSRNSGVVHAGLYYPADSLKAKLCVRGRQLLTERSKNGHFELRRVGKLIVATSEEDRNRLDGLARNAAASGVGLLPLDAADVRRLEPSLRAAAGMLSPESGIVDAHELARDFHRGARAAGATFAMATEVDRLELESSFWLVHTRQPDGTRHAIGARFIVNAAGLDADRIARLAGLDVDGLGLRQHLCKGSYFNLAPRVAAGLSHLVYPLPHGPGLGIHLTLDLAGALRAGPDAEYVTTRDYAVDERKREPFAEAIGHFLPAVRPEDLSPAYAGIRPKLAAAGEPFRDFVIRHEADRGLPGLVNLLGIESPGLTASPAIAEAVAELIRGTD